jgi:ComF family protein
MAYSDLIKKLIVEIKYNGYFAYLSQLAELMVKLSKSTDFLDKAIFTAVPLSRFKRWRRGFNQAELLARQIAASHDGIYLSLLERVINTETQVGKDKSARQDNLLNAFRATNTEGLPEVVIVDDIMTTGTTLERCAKCLKQVGVEKVYGLVLARGA